MIALDACPPPGRQHLFCITYASRSTSDPGPADVAQLAEEAARRNARKQISGVILHGGGVYLQWLEGPGDDVCTLMSRIEKDPRHHDVTILNAGWIPERRYSNWPMHLDAHRLDSAWVRPSDAPDTNAPYDAGLAEVVFDELAAIHRRQGPTGTPELVPDDRFMAALVSPVRERLPELPDAALANLQMRATLIDETCHCLRHGWQTDTFNTFEIALGLAGLNRLWQRAGRVPDPIGSRHSICVVVPPGSSEILGAIVKADLLRAAGASVHQILENDERSLFAALADHTQAPILVAGPRVGLNGDGARAGALAKRLQKRFPRRAIHLGGRTAGPLAECPKRLALPACNTDLARDGVVPWLALTAIACLGERQRLQTLLSA